MRLLGAQERLFEITDILSTVPSRESPDSSMFSPYAHSFPRTPAAIEDQVRRLFLPVALLTVAYSDLLRALNRELGSPINPFEITVEYCIEATRRDSLAHGEFFVSTLLHASDSVMSDPSWGNWVRANTDYYICVLKLKAFKWILPYLPFSSWFISEPKERS